MSLEQNFKDELNACKTMNEIFNVVNKFYDMDQKLGVASKAVIVSQMGRIINIVGAKERKKSNNLKVKSWS